MKTLLALISTLAIAGTAHARSTVEVWARAYHNSCSYYSSTSSDFDVTFRDGTLPWGTKVTLVSGLVGESADSSGFHEVHWDFREEQEMQAIAGHTWLVRRSPSLGERAASRHYSGIEFVIKIEEPGHSTPRFINPTGQWGYWRATLDRQQISCANGSNLPPFKQIHVESVQVDLQ